MTRPALGVLLAVAALVAAALAGCSRGDGRTLAEPAPGATAPPRTTATTDAAIAPASPAPTLSITSDAFAGGEAIPTHYSCDGEAVSPPLRWTGVTDEAAALALVVADEDAGGFVHWVVWNIPRDTAAVAEGASPPGVEGRNHAGGTGWAPPCPPVGEAHRYVFTIHALRRSLELDADADPRTAVAAAEGASLANARLTGVFVRQ